MPFWLGACGPKAKSASSTVSSQIPQLCRTVTVLLSSPAPKAIRYLTFSRLLRSKHSLKQSFHAALFFKLSLTVLQKGGVSSLLRTVSSVTELLSPPHHNHKMLFWWRNLSQTLLCGHPAFCSSPGYCTCSWEKRLSAFAVTNKAT